MITVTARSGMTLAIAIDSSSLRRSASPARLSLISTNVEGIQAGTATGVCRTLAKTFRKLALGTLLQPADGSDHDPHARRYARQTSGSKSRGSSGSTSSERSFDSRGQLARRPCDGAEAHIFLEIVEGADVGAEHMTMTVTGVDQHPVAMRHAFDPRVRHTGLDEVFQHAIATEPTCRFDLPEVTTMQSAIDDLPVRSMVTVSSASMSSRRARTRRRISSALGRTWRPGRRRGVRQHERMQVLAGPFLSLS